LAKIANWEYPQAGLLESVLVARRVARDFGGEVSRSALARSLGMSERGGAFAARLGAARMWGVCSGRGTIRLTAEGLRTAEPRSREEDDEARRALASSVPLFVEIVRRTGGRVVDERRLAVLLEEITGAGRLEAARRAPQMVRLVNEVLGYLAERQPHVRGQDPESLRQAPLPVDASGAQTEAGRSRIEISLPDGRMSLPESVAGLDAAMLMLRARREALAARDGENVAPDSRGQP